MGKEELARFEEIPSGLISAASRAAIVPFIGAGASRLTGLPNWDEFANTTIDQCMHKQKLNHAQKAQLSGLSPKTKLSIAKDLLESKIDYEDILGLDGLKKAKEKLHAKGQRLYSNISKMSKKFVTTNYDLWLDTIPEPKLKMEGDPSAPSSSPSDTKKRDSIYKVEEFTWDKFVDPSNETVLHLHGSIVEPDKMIMTIQDYVRHYANDRGRAEPNNVLTFLTDLFIQRTVLFIGYGLEEMEILEYVLTKGLSSGHGKHYIVQGFFRHENELRKHLTNYYKREFNIGLIPFFKDENGFDELIELLDHLAKNLPAPSQQALQEMSEMGRMIDV